MMEFVPDVEKKQGIPFTNWFCNKMSRAVERISCASVSQRGMDLMSQA